MGNTITTVQAIWDQSFPPKSKFSTDQIPDLTGRIALVTGGNVGIGKETVKTLLERNAKVYMGSRSRDKAEASIEDLKKLTGKEAVFLEIDLSSLNSVKEAAEEFSQKEKELHILFLNAGVMLPPQEQLTKEGYDLTFGTNVIGHFLLAKLLMPKLLAGKETSPDKYARIITTSSAMAYFTTLDWDSFKDGPARGKMGMNTLYAQSKFANAVVARELARRYGHQGILSISVNPGNLKTEMQRNIGWFQQTFLNTMLWPAHYGALTQLWAGTMPEAINYNGEFMIPWARPGKCRAEVYDPGVGEKLWNWLEEAVKPFTK